LTPLFNACTGPVTYRWATTSALRGVIASLKQMPWDRPSGSRIPNRPGDRSKTEIFTALGYALSAWEGVNAAVRSLAFALHSALPEEDCEQQMDKFDALFKAHDRAQFSRHAAMQFLIGDFGAKRPQAAKFKKNFKREMGAYCEWVARRNELAHGYVTEAMSPDYSDPEQPIIAVYALLPSHARTDRFFHGEPEWNYIAKEIEMFGLRFSELDDRLEQLARNAALLQQERREPKE